MVNPVTVNLGIIVPLTGADVDTWGEDDVNPNMVAIDGMLAGVQTIAVTTGAVVLTKPAGFTATPSPGPTQSQNRVLKFTGTLIGHVGVTLPLPGVYVIDNRTVSGGFVLYFQSAAPAKLVCVPSGECFEIYCDGTDVCFVGLGRTGAIEMWAGLSAMPTWVTSSTVDPYLMCDGSVYNHSDYPALAARLAGTFGGNGITTFGVPDLRGRVPLAYDGTGTRITAAGCGLNGQTLGASIDSQQATLTNANQIPSLTSVNASQNISVNTIGNLYLVGPSLVTTSTPGSGAYAFNSIPPSIGQQASSGANSISVAYTNASPQGHPNVQPSMVTGIYVIKT